MRKAVYFILTLSLLLSGCAKNGIMPKQKNLPSSLNDSYYRIKTESDVAIIKRLSDKVIFEAGGIGVSTKYERPIEAEKRAEKNALSKAVKATGVYVYSGFQNILGEYNERQYEIIGRYLNVWAENLVEYKRTGKPICAFDKDIYKCAVKIKGTVYFRGSADPNFKIKAELGKYFYADGENINLKLTVNKDSYISIINCDEQGAVSLLFPNKYAEDNFIKANHEFSILNGANFQLKAFLPKGQIETAEIIHIIATKNKPLFVPDSLEKINKFGFITYPMGRLGELAAKLAKFKRSSWTSQILFYAIQNKKNNPWREE